MKTTAKKCMLAFYSYLLSFTQTQMLLTLLALPILVGWGLGWSLMALVGNLIFTPVLTVFLVISSLLLFTQLLGIPNGYLALALDKLTVVWDKVLHLGSPSWIVENACPSRWILFLVPIAAFFVLRHCYVNTPLKRIGAMCVLLAFFCSIFSLQRYFNTRNQLTYRFNDKLYMIKLANHNSVIVIDDGYGSRKKSIEKAVNFDIKPWLAKHVGSVTIKEWRVNAVTAGCLKTAAYACTLWPVEAVWLPFFKKPLSKAGWRAYFDLKRQLAAKGIRFVRYKMGR